MILFIGPCLSSPFVSRCDHLVPQGELGESGQKGGKGDKGEHVSLRSNQDHIVLFIIIPLEALSLIHFYCIFVGFDRF